MAKKSTTSFVCQECGYDSPQWLGKCPECGNWNSMKEFHMSPATQKIVNSGMVAQSIKPQKLQNIAYQEKSRIQTNYSELNTVLGGGIVRGSATLIAGDPGVGKSTLLLQLALSLAASPNSARVSRVSSDVGKSGSKVSSNARSLSESRLRIENKKSDGIKPTFSSLESVQMSAYKVL